MKKPGPIILCILVFLLGFGVMFYPSLSNFIYERNASYVITDYQENAGIKNTEEAQALFDEARAYNATVSGRPQDFMEAEKHEENGTQDEIYWESFGDLNGIIGVIDIPSIAVSLPIYHGTEESTLQKGVGHLEGSALPTGDIGNHTVLTGHTGLPSAQLFTDLDKLSLGDTFSLEVLNKIFTYEVSAINVVLPSETELLVAQEGKDLVTLITCTPYGINSHRLLVTGELKESSDLEIAQPDTGDDDTSLLPQVTLPTLFTIAGLLALVFLGAILRFLWVSRKKKDDT